MKINDLYNCFVEHNNMTYSIDMLRVKTYVTYEEYNSLDFYLRAYYKDKIKRFWISNRISDFRYNWNIEIEEGKSFWFGFCHNMEEKLPERLDPEYNFTIEFNPNKLKDDKLIKRLLLLGNKWYIVRYDLAIDMKVNILDLIIDKSGKRKYKVFGSSFDNKTYILGGKGGGQVKIYNKKIESDLSITGSMTRIELTIDCNEFFVGDIAFYNYDFKFPDIYLSDYVYSLEDYIGRSEGDKTLYAIMFAVQNGYPINDLSRTYKEKLKKIFKGGYQVKFDLKSSRQVLIRTIIYYFLHNPRCIFK